MGENTPLPVHNKIFDLLNRRTSGKIFVNEFYNLIENIRVNGDILNNIRLSLLKEGLTERQADRICSDISWKMRFTRRDSRDIMDDLIDMGWIRRKNYVIEILKKK